MTISRNKILALVFIFLILAVVLKNKSRPVALKSSNNYGILVSTIGIELKANEEELKVFSNGITPWINLEETEENINRLINPDQIVLPYSAVTLSITYPLAKPATFELKTNNKWWTRKQLVEEISRKYHFIYREDALKVLTPELRKKLSNNKQADVEYGIWGHNLIDLDLSKIEVYNLNGKIILQLSVES